MASRKQLSTQPFNTRIQQDTQDFQRLIAILIVLCVFVWENRITFLVLADNINQAFDWLKAIQQTWRYWVYCLSLILNPLPYGPG